MTRYAFLVALLVVAMVSPASAGLDHIPNGLVIGAYPAEDSADVTPGDNDLHVVGTVEVDGAARFDGAVTFTSTVDVSGSVTFSGAMSVGTDLTVGDELYFYEAGGLLISNKIDVDANEAFVFYGPTDDDNLANVPVTIMSTSEVAVYEALGVGKADGNDDKTITMYAGDKTDATIVYDYSDDDIDISKEIGAAAGLVTGADIISDTADTDSCGTVAVPWAISCSTESDMTTLGDVAGTDVATLSGANIDFAGTVDITGATTLDSTLGVAGITTVGGNVVSDTTGTDQLGTFTVTFAAVVGDEGNFDTIGDATDGTDAIVIGNDGSCTFQQKMVLGSSAKVLRRVWIPVDTMNITQPGAPPTASSTGTAYTLTFDQDSAVDYVWFTWVVPQDCDTASDAEMYVVYTPSSDAAAAAAGNWSSEINAISDGSTVAAAAVALEDITDTPQGNQGDGTMAKWNTTAGATIPNANLAADTVINFNLYHDYAVAAFGNDPLLAGVYIEYVVDKLGE